MKHHSVIMKLIEENNIKVFAEIGVWRSRMIKWVLRSDCSNILEEYWAVDKWDVLGPGYGRMSRISYDRWTDLYVYSCGLMRYFKQLKVLRLSSERASTLFPDNYFGMVYIDSDHKYEESKKDNLLWLPKVKDNGILGVHDYCVRKTKDHRVKIAFDELFGAEGIYTDIDTVAWIRVTNELKERVQHGRVQNGA